MQATRTMRTVLTAGFTALLLSACGGGDGGPGVLPPPGVLSLAVGEGRTLAASQAATIEISGGAAGAEFVLVPFHASTSPTLTVALEFSGTQITGVTGPPTPQRAPATAPTLSIEGAGSLMAREAARVRFDAALRRLERDIFARRIPAARAARSLRASASVAGSGLRAAAVPAVGDPMTLNTNAKPGLDQTCHIPELRTGTVMAVSNFTVIVADNANPAGGFTQADYAAIGQEFDALVQPVLTDNFGLPSDIDANAGRSVVFYTHAVNEMTPPGSESFIGGFFHPRDLFPKVGPNPNSTEDDCPTSNEAEMFYMLVPVPNGRSFEALQTVRRTTVGTLGHEYQHLINASRHIANNASSFEAVWLNEGMSHIAEELLFYRASSLTTRQNITLTQLLSTQTIKDAVNAYQIANFSRLVDYLENPEVRSPYDEDDELATRGATWQFLRYAADRSSTPERTLWRNLANSRNLGIANVTAVFGGDFLSLVRDWATAQYTDDDLTTTAALRHPSWHFKSIVPAVIDQNNPPSYPLRTRALVNGTPLSLTLEGGSSAYLRFGVAAGQTGRITPTSSGAALPNSVSVTVVRTK